MKSNALKIIILIASVSTHVTAGGFSAADTLSSGVARCLGLRSLKDAPAPKPGVIHQAELVFNERVVAALLKIDTIDKFIQTLNELIKSKARGLDVIAEDRIQWRLLELAGGNQAPYAKTLHELHQLLTIDEQAAAAPDERQPVKVDFSLVVSNTLKDSDYAYVSSGSPETTRMDLGSRQHYFNWYMSTPQSPLFDKDIYCFQEWDGQLGDALKRAGYEWIENLTTGLVIAFKNSKFKKIASSGDTFKNLPLAGSEKTFSSSGHFGYLVAFLESKQDANLKLGILNTHLQSRPTDPVGAKEAMIKKLVGLVEQSGMFRNNWIVCGDFNIDGLNRSTGSQFDTLLRPLRQEGFTNIVPSQVTSFAKPTKGSQTDYAFLKGNFIHKGIMFIPQDANQLLKYAADGSDARTTFFSDHAAIVADLALQ